MKGGVSTVNLPESDIVIGTRAVLLGWSAKYATKEKKDSQISNTLMTLNFTITNKTKCKATAKRDLSVGLFCASSNKLHKKPFEVNTFFIKSRWK